MLLLGCLLAVSPAGGLLTRADPVSLSDLLSRRSPGERPEGARSDKRPLQRMKPALAAEPPSSLAQELATAALPEQPLLLPDALPLALAAEDPDLAFAVDPTPFAQVEPIRVAVDKPPERQPSLTLISHVPEPATWLTMLVGFGLLGATLRSARLRPAQSPLPIRRR